MSLASIDLSQYCIVRHRDTDKVYVYESTKYLHFLEATEQQTFVCYALYRYGHVNTVVPFTFEKEQLYLQPIRPA